MKKTRVTRKEKREALETFNLCIELWKIIRHFFSRVNTVIKGNKRPPASKLYQL